MQNDQQQSPKVQMFVLKIMWASFLFVPILLFVVLKLVPEVEPVEIDLEQVKKMTTLFTAMAFVSGAMSLFLPRMVFKSELLKRKDQPNLTFSSLIQLKATPHVMSLALAESVCIFGFILAKIHHQTHLFPAFMVASILLVLAQFPSENRIRSEAQNILGAHRNIP